MATVKKAKKYQGGGDVPSWASKVNKQTEDERKNPALGDERRRKADSTAMANWKKAANFERAYHKKEGNKIEDRKSGSTAYTVLAKKKEMKTGGAVKKYKSGGSLSGLKASNKRVGPVDPKGAYTTVQKRTLAGAKGKAVLKKDKQLGATKMKMGGAMKKCKYGCK
jgi:hypothetical protein